MTFRDVHIASKGYIWDAQKLCRENGLCFEEYLDMHHNGRGITSGTTISGVTYYRSRPNCHAGGGSGGGGDMIRIMDLQYHGCVLE